MNYLAHLYLAEQSSEGLLGSLLGDFVKGRLDDRYPETVRRGIALHRAIDSFTDAHPLHRESRNRIGGERRRYAGIIIRLLRPLSVQSLDGVLGRKPCQLLGTRLRHFARSPRRAAGSPGTDGASHDCR